MSEPDKRSIGQIIVDFVQSAGRPVSLEEIARHLTDAGRNPVNARMDATCYSVNMNSRVHYASAKPERRTDPGNRYDKLFRQADGRFVPYEPAVHGVWEIYSDDSGTKRVRLALEPTAEPEHGDTPAVTAYELYDLTAADSGLIERALIRRPGGDTDQEYREAA